MHHLGQFGFTTNLIRKSRVPMHSMFQRMCCITQVRRCHQKGTTFNVLDEPELSSNIHDLLSLQWSIVFKNVQRHVSCTIVCNPVVHSQNPLHSALARTMGLFNSIIQFAISKKAIQFPFLQYVAIQIGFFHLVKCTQDLSLSSLKLMANIFEVKSLSGTVQSINQLSCMSLYS